MDFGPERIGRSPFTIGAIGALITAVKFTPAAEQALEPIVEILPIRNDDRVLVIDTKPFHNQRVIRLYRTRDHLVAARVREHWRIGNYDYFPGDLRFFP